MAKQYERGGKAVRDAIELRMRSTLCGISMTLLAGC
jgi:hypothetical protein